MINIAHLMACVIARELENDDILAIGLNAEIMLAAGFIAKQLYCPNLKINVGARQFNANIELSSPAWTHIKTTSNPFSVNKWTAHDEILTVNNGSSESFCNIFFVGGIQIDKFGNTNLIGIKNKNPKTDSVYKIRGPGSIGTTSIATLAKKYYCFSTEHSIRKLVDKVDFVSVPGYNTRKQFGLKGGPKLIITPLAVFDFPSGRARLRSYHSNTSISEIKQKTGFDFKSSGAVITAAPKEEELNIIKSIDKTKELEKIQMIY